MAELEIQKKPDRRWWPWLLLVAVVAVAAWWFGWNTNEDANPALAGLPVPGAPAMDTMAAGDSLGVMPVVPAASVPGAPDAVNDYLAFAAEGRQRGAVGLDHEYTADGIRRLADALTAVAEQRDVATDVVSARADSLRGFAGTLQEEPNSRRHADLAHRAFLLATRILDDLQRAGAGDSVTGAVDNARRAAEAVQPQTPLLDQTSAVQRYFDAAGAALETMTGQRG
ncbi:MAG TPA: hypothetical protein VFS08_16530 [Gemmatimonadaceae bacterium]|nr:hypothetical protein [Gemmatimonadaceae bacterium]